MTPIIDHLKSARRQEIHKIDAQASKLMKQGIRLMAGEPQESIRRALDCFDRALELRRNLPFETSALLGYGLAACWLNRGDALMRLRDVGHISAALHSYEEAITLLRRLPLHEDARFSKRLAIARQNHGLVLQTQGSTAEAIQAFSEALAVLEHEYAAQIQDRLYLLAAVWANLANAQLSEGGRASEVLALEGARRAMGLVSDLEVIDEDAAEIGMKARHMLCRAIAGQISGKTTVMADRLHEATDAADTGLHLARQWEQKGVTRFRGVARDLFLFGIRLYARFQPQFLSEFVAENMDPTRSSPEYVKSAEMRAAAQEAFESPAHD